MSHLKQHNKANASKSVFLKDINCLEAITGLGLILHNKDVIKLRKYLKMCYENIFCIFEAQQLNDINHNALLDNNFKDQLFRAFLELRHPINRGSVYIFGLFKSDISNIKDILPKTYMKWPFIEKNMFFLAAIYLTSHSTDLKAFTPVFEADYRHNLKDIILETFPKIREIGLELPEIMGSNGHHPIDEIFAGNIQGHASNTWDNLKLICNKWLKLNNEPQVESIPNLTNTVYSRDGIGRDIFHYNGDFKTVTKIVDKLILDFPNTFIRLKEFKIKKYKINKDEFSKTWKMIFPSSKSPELH